MYSALNGFSLYDNEAFGKILLCAPTGKASKRITEQTLFGASTIHKALGYNFESEFVYDGQNPLPHRLIVIDEVSMIDTILASHLLEAISFNATVIFVGDAFQLPSIAPGAFLEDLISSKAIPTTYLKTIYRQGKQSNIVKLADMVKQGEVDYKIFNQDYDLTYVPSSPIDVLDKVNNLINIHLDLGYSLAEDIQVLVPMYKGQTGIDAFNKSISDNFNTDYSYTVSTKEKVFKDVVEFCNK